MTDPLTADQRTRLETALRQRQQALDEAIARHRDGSRADHAREVLLQDGDDAPQRDSDSEIDLALSDREMAELGEVSRALARVHKPGFGLCQDCGAAIPFDRLRLEPWALRCVTCQARAEARP